MALLRVGYLMSSHYITIASKPLYHYCVKAALLQLSQSRFTTIGSPQSRLSHVKPLYHDCIKAALPLLRQRRFTATASKSFYRYCIKALLPLMCQSHFTAIVSKLFYRYCLKALLPLLRQSHFTAIALTALKHRICLLSYLQLLETVVTWKFCNQWTITALCHWGQRFKLLITDSLLPIPQIALCG